VNVPARRRSAELLPFTNEESFGLFVEGLRSLQRYEDAAATEHPSKDELDRTIQIALRFFRECTSHFPSDLLPFFYLGVTLSMKNQEVYVDRLVELTPEITAFGRYLVFDDEAQLLQIVPADEAHKTKTQREEKRVFAAKRAIEEKSFAQPFSDLAQRPWPLLEASSRLFESLANKPDHSVPPQLKRVARYNWAQVLARRGSREEKKYLTTAFRAIKEQDLDKIAKLESLAKRQENKYRELSKIPESIWKRSWPPARNKRKRELKKLGREIRSIYETIALRFQFSALRETIKLRIAALDPGPTFAPDAHHVDSVRRKIEGTRLFDPGFKADLLADYLTKTGYAKYEFASNRELKKSAVTDKTIADALQVAPPSLPNAIFFMGQAATDLTMALELKEYWNPAQIYLALVRRIQAGMYQARSDLAKHDKDSALADDMRSKAHTEHAINDASVQEAQATKDKNSAEMHRFGTEKLAYLDGLDKLNARIEKNSVSFDRQIADYDREAKRFAAEADALFNSLQGISPTPPAAAAASSGSTPAPAKPASPDPASPSTPAKSAAS
jgi:hypothetical protein